MLSEEQLREIRAVSDAWEANKDRNLWHEGVGATLMGAALKLAGVSQDLLDEIKGLREEVALRDKVIKQLNQRINALVGK